MSERFECTTLAKEALYKYSSFPLLSIYTIIKITSVGDGRLLVVGVVETLEYEPARSRR